MKNVILLLVVLSVGCVGGYFARMVEAESRFQRNFSALSPDAARDLDRLARVLGDIDNMKRLDERNAVQTERMQALLAKMLSEEQLREALLYERIDQIGWPAFKKVRREELKSLLPRSRTGVDPEAEKVLVRVFPGLDLHPATVD